ncbi:hypothetical protein [Tengunoibacter tsumagoiensis]|uniref:Uncharacterized protein n=1 Tax=Tengunoibacter tsumagoiensis TaxID=2014871 RepID=A0A402A842_9CHLR|nr:hypothetical protein [Tengunoibacter tsumagoiensis]GCE15313.1 hypothetical protein KTT_51720 [Tengunoibacter tsumagoiensis]
MTTPAPPEEQWTPKRIIAELPFIPALSSWIKLLLSLLAEPMMFGSALFMIAETVIPSAAHWSPTLTYGAQTVMSIAPEIILAGALQLARKTQRSGNKVKAVLLFSLCSMFGLLTLITVASLIWDFSGIAGKFLLFLRVIAGIGYTIIVHLPEENSGEHEVVKAKDMQAHLTEFAAFLQQSQANLFTSIQVSMDTMRVQVNALEQRVTELVNTLGEQEQSAREQVNVLVNARPEDLAHLDQRFDGLRSEMFQQIEDLARLMDNLSNGFTQVSHTIRKVEISVSEVKQSRSGSQEGSRALASPRQKGPKLLKSAPKQHTEDLGQLEALPPLIVEGLAPEVVQRILTDHIRRKMSWRNIGGNYMKTVKPVKDAYEMYLLAQSSSQLEDLENEEEEEDLLDDVVHDGTVVDSLPVSQLG